MLILGVFLSLVFLFSLVSKRVEKTIISAPMVFCLAGMVLFWVMPSITKIEIENKTILALGEITLAIVLFTEFTRLSLKQTMRESQLPARLLGIGMPLSIVFGSAIALLVLTDLSLWEAAVLSTILAPTDASLGIAVVNSRRVPERIRNALKVEGGLNDGLSIPLLMLFIALAEVSAPKHDTSWILYTAQQIGFGMLVGIALGWVGGQLMALSERRDWMADPAQQLALLALGIISWWLAEKVVGGNGFIATFVAGGMVRLSFESAHERITEFDEAWGDLLIYLVFLLFGIIAAPEILLISASIWIFGALSLTIVRMLPVAIAMIGARLQFASVLFLGWFGPRGLASVVLGLIFLEERTNFPGETTIVLAVIATVFLSILAHGISSAPAIEGYSRKVSELSVEAPEHQKMAGV